jgi:hypothetical protein
VHFKEKTMNHKTFAATILSVFALLVFLPGMASAQSLTAEDVTAVMESPAVKDGFDKCAAAYPHAESINFIFLVEADGQASLTKTDPAVDANLFVCFQTAAKNIKLKATGKKLEITYPMQFAPYTAAPPQPVTGSGAIVVLPSTTMQTQPAPQPTPQPVAAGGKTAPDPYWYGEYKKGRGLLIAGAVLLPVGGVATLGSLFAMAAYSATCSFAEAWTFGAAECEVPDVLPVLFFVGLAVMITGIVLLAVGSVKKRRAYNRMYSAFLPQLGIAPTIDGEGAYTTLRWYF